MMTGHTKVTKKLEPEDGIEKAIIRLTEEIIEVKALVMDLCKFVMNKEL